MREYYKPPKKIACGTYTRVYPGCSGAGGSGAGGGGGGGGWWWWWVVCIIHIAAA